MIGISGIRLRDITIGVDENGAPKVSGKYELLSTAGRVLAKQAFNGYDDMKIQFSTTTCVALDAFLNAATTEVKTMLGLNEIKEA